MANKKTASKKTHDSASRIENGHTPGPWYVGNGGYAVLGAGTSIAILVDVEGSQIETAAVMATRVERDERLANARLLAAAPSLLSALNILVDAVNVNELDPLVIFASIEKARAAIELAQGGTV